MCNVYVHPAATGNPKAIQLIEARTGLTARPRGSVVMLERTVVSLRGRARDLLRAHRPRHRRDGGTPPTAPSIA